MPLDGLPTVESLVSRECWLDPDEGRVPFCQLDDKFCKASAACLEAEGGTSTAVFTVTFDRIWVVLPALEEAVVLRDPYCEES
eukprot:CAMPEP_0176125864 /NCGR_PEP_ID=MMETSP0120_2-20121206/63513_1 /TAXON_ID=160619 /ORGANISM="Kryptoperidinium foliaceum, Strain CCMP 1326" /LENGTH=82 /DNA_ID=CAMNT_0017460759 /DNA_START=386 /DNA_END=631 /DNA_ORIENTATION=+